jgi:hypothetical protein
MCKTSGCKQQAVYGYEYKKFIACAKCKKNGMRNARYLYCSCGKKIKYCKITNTQLKNCIDCKINNILRINNIIFNSINTEKNLNRTIPKYSENDLHIYTAQLLLKLKYS